MAIGTSAAILGGAAISGVAGSSAASKAASAQKSAAKQASATQLKMFEQSRKDQEPWRVVGQSGLNELAIRMGIAPYAGTAPKVEDEAAIRNRLMAGYGGTTGGLSPAGTMVVYDEYGQPETIRAPAGVPAQTQAAVPADIEARIQQELASQQTKLDKFNASKNAYKNDPDFGSMLRNFTAADMEADPVYKSGLQFGLDQGMRSVNNSFAAGGKLLSGAAAKAATKFANDYASTKGNESYNRFENNKAGTFNKLASLAGVGQTAAKQIGSQGIATGNAIAQNQIGAGNARASGYMGQANALTGAIGQGFNMYQSNQFMNALNSGRTPGFSGVDYQAQWGGI